MKVRQDGRIVSVAATIATVANTNGRREVLGMAVGASEAETFRTDFLRSLAQRVLRASWQRCRVLVHAGRSHRRVVAAWIGTAFAEADADAARKQ